MRLARSSPRAGVKPGPHPRDKPAGRVPATALDEGEQVPQARVLGQPVGDGVVQPLFDKVGQDLMLMSRSSFRIALVRISSWVKGAGGSMNEAKTYSPFYRSLSATSISSGA